MRDLMMKRAVARGNVSLSSGKTVRRAVFAACGVLAFSAGAETVTSLRWCDNGHSKLFEAALDGTGNTYYWSDHLAPHAEADYVSTHVIRSHTSATTVPCASFDIRCPFWVKTTGHAIDFTGPLTFSGTGGRDSNNTYIGNWGANGALTLSSDVSIGITTPAATPLWGYPAADVREADSAKQKYTLKAPKITAPATAGVILSENPVLNAGIAAQTFSLRFEGDCSEFLGSVEMRKGGRLYFAGTEPGFPARLTVRRGATLALETAASDVSSLTLDDGASLELAVDAATDAVASLAVSNFSRTGFVNLMLVPSAELAKDYDLSRLGAVLRVPVSSGLTADDINVTIASRAVSGLPIALLVATDADGVRSFSFKAMNVVTLTASDGSGKSSFVTNSAGVCNWSDGLWPDVGKDYQVGAGKTLRTFQGNNWPTDVFVGDSLILDRGELGLKDPGSIRELFLVNSDNGNTSPRVTSYGDITNRISGGRVYLETWSIFALPVYAGSWIGKWGLTNGGWPRVIEPRYTRIDSRICGSGTLVALIGNPGADEDFQRPGYLELAADNACFTGSFVVKSEYSRSTVTNGQGSVVMWLAFSEEKNLGSRNGVYSYQAIQLDRGGLWAKETVDLTDTNRGIEITGHEAGAWFRADAGKTFAIRSQITMRKPIHKVGGGTLALGGLLSHVDSSGKIAPVAGQNEFYVEEGFVRALSTNAFNGAALAFSAGTGVEIDGDETDAVLRDKGFLNVKWNAPFDLTDCGGKLRVRVTSAAAKFSKTPFGVVTVSAAAPDLSDSFVFDLPYENCEAVVTRIANADSTVTYRARLRSTRGLRVIVR